MRSGRSLRGGASASVRGPPSCLTHVRQPAHGLVPCAQNPTRPPVWGYRQANNAEPILRRRASGCTSSPSSRPSHFVGFPQREVQIADNHPVDRRSGRVPGATVGSSKDLLAHRSDSCRHRWPLPPGCGSAVADPGGAACQMGAVTDHAMGVTASRQIVAQLTPTEIEVLRIAVVCVLRRRSGPRRTHGLVSRRCAQFDERLVPGPSLPKPRTLRIVDRGYHRRITPHPCSSWAW